MPRNGFPSIVTIVFSILIFTLSFVVLAAATPLVVSVLHSLRSFRQTLLGHVGSDLKAGITTGQYVDSDKYFYGQSPPVYPTPKGVGTGNWADAYRKAERLVSQMTLVEKTNLTIGLGYAGNSCAGTLGSIPHLGFTGFCLQDAGNGIRGTDFVNAYASGLSVGASWNKRLALERARYMGAEYKAKGVHVALGPVVGPIGRIVMGGRNWEGFSVDPYLCGTLAAETVSGIQEKGVITSIKHYIGNEQETYRREFNDPNGKLIEGISSNIDDKTMHELYLWPFQDALRAGTGNIMCSYQRVNNSYPCGNSKLMNGILKTELGFQGFVVTDWGAQHSGVASALAGLDMVMPWSDYWRFHLTEAVENKTVPVEHVDDMATRIIATWYQMKQDSGFPPLGEGMPPSLTSPHKMVNARDPASKQTILDGAIEGHVLVKNENNILPLKSPQLLSLYGYSAKAYDTNTGNPQWLFGYGGLNDSDFEAFRTGFRGGDSPAIAPGGNLICGGGSGTNAPPYVNSPFDALQERAWKDNTALHWDFRNPGADGPVDPQSDACLVFINAFATEGADRPNLADEFSDRLVINIANKCENTIVVIHNAGVRLVDTWVNHPQVKAIIYAHLPGQDSGRALVSLLYGDVSPSGKLPYTVAKSIADYGNLAGPDRPDDEYFKYFPQSNFTEGVYLDYRAFDKAGIEPLYEFGFGLSYTSFSISNLNIKKIETASTASYPTGPITQGGHDDLWDVIATVSAEVTNTGEVYGAEVAQLYVGIPGGPIKQLRGYEKVGLKPNQTEGVDFNLTRRDLSEWDVVAQKWKLEGGDYVIWVGQSSRILPLTGMLTI